MDVWSSVFPLSMNLYQHYFYYNLFLIFVTLWFGKISYSFPEAFAKPVFMIYVITHHVNIGRPTVKWIKAHLQSVYLCVCYNPKSLREIWKTEYLIWKWKVSITVENAGYMFMLMWIPAQMHYMKSAWK